VWDVQEDKIFPKKCGMYNEVKKFPRSVGCTRDWKLFKKRVNFDAGKFSFGNINIV